MSKLAPFSTTRGLVFCATILMICINLFGKSRNFPVGHGDHPKINLTLCYMACRDTSWYMGGGSN